MELRKATIDDISSISLLLNANKDEVSLYRKTYKEISNTINDFIIAKFNDDIAACVALHKYNNRIAEISSVAVLKQYQNSGIGKRLINECIQTAISDKISVLWLSTAKPSYFAKFGFTPISKNTIPYWILIEKIKTVFKQPIIRWLPSLFGRYTFMRYAN